jgi:hypothetical protein
VPNYVPVDSQDAANFLVSEAEAAGMRAFGRPAIEAAQQHLAALARTRNVTRRTMHRRWYDPAHSVYFVDAEPLLDQRVDWSPPFILWPFDWDGTLPGEAEPVPIKAKVGYEPMPVEMTSYDDLCAEAHPVDLAGLLAPHVNAMDQTGVLKMVMWLTGAWHPDGGPYPLLYCYGPTGVAKTMSQLRLASLVDPRTDQVQSTFPKDTDAIERKALEREVLLYDNLSTAPVWFQNILAQLSTRFQGMRHGEPFDLCRPILANGLEMTFDRPDLQARTLHVRLAPFAARIPDGVLAAAWQDVRPRLQAALFYIVSAA